MPRNPSPPRPAASTVEALDAIRRIMRGLRLAAKETQDSSGVSAAQLFVLSSLRDSHEEASLSMLAERTMTDRSSVAAVVDRLVERGLVTRRTSTTDRRRAAIALTARGRALLARASASPTEQLVAALTGLQPATRTGLARGLTALAEAMGLADERAGLMFDERSEGDGAARPGVKRR